MTNFSNATTIFVMSLSFILDIISLIFEITICILLTLSLRMSTASKKNGGGEKKFIEDIDFIEDILNYCMQKELKVSVMENVNGNLALYEMQEDGSSISITELFISANKKGSKEYEEMLGEITHQIDAFIENRESYKKANK